MNTSQRIFVIILVILSVAVGMVGHAQAEENLPPGELAPEALPGTAFTYQGQLNYNGSPVSQHCDFQFSLYAAESGGSALGTYSANDVTVTNGYFTTKVDFGYLFTGEARWLAISVSCPTGSGTFTPLTQRQQLTPTPYALALPGLYTMQNTTSPNIMGGYFGNWITSGVVGATIAGGGHSGELNRVTDAYGTVGGGRSNQAGDNAGTNSDKTDATISGGLYNIASGYGSAIGGGGYNTASNWYTTIAGGDSNQATGDHATVGGGSSNQATSDRATVCGGGTNVASGSYASICGGGNNTATNWYAVVAGGDNNDATGNHAVVGGGTNNTASASHSAVLGGENNTASGAGAFIGGGGYDGAAHSGNTATGGASVLGGGLGNSTTITGTYATLGGGLNNKAAGYGAVIGGGGYNKTGNWYATVAGGDSNQAIGDHATIGGGGSNTIPITGTYATIAGGSTNTASGNSATVCGGYENSASGENSTVIGGSSASATEYGQMAYASGSFANPGDAQASMYVLRGTSSDTIITHLHLDGSSEHITIPENHTMAYDILIVGRSSNGEAAGYRITGVIDRPSGSLARNIGTHLVTIFGEDDAAWTVGAGPNVDYLIVVVAGNTGDTIRWVASVRITDVGW